MISGEFEHKDDYIDIVMGITSLLNHQFVKYIINDSLDHNFSLYRAIFIRKEDSENWNEFAKLMKMGQATFAQTGEDIFMNAFSLMLEFYSYMEQNLQINLNQCLNIPKRNMKIIQNFKLFGLLMHLHSTSL